VYVANLLGRTQDKPTCQYIEQIKRTWRYLSGTKDLGIVLGGEDSIEELRLWLHCNTSWANDPKNCKTTTRHVIFLGNSPIK